MTIGKRWLTLATIAAIFIIGIGSWAIQKQITKASRLEVEKSLTTVLAATEQAIRTWVKDQKAAALIWASTVEAHHLAQSLVRTLPTKEVLAKSSDQLMLRTWIKPVLDARKYQGFFLIGPNNYNLGSMRNVNLGKENLLAKEEIFLSQIWSGKTTLSLPLEIRRSASRQNGKTRTWRSDHVCRRPDKG